MNFNQSGRSMIEMLGVLAIIAVLSVVGVAGYSKAMEKFKVNKIVTEYNMLIQGLLEYKPKLGKENFNINELVSVLNLIPNTWKKDNGVSDNLGGFIDSYGNRIRIGYRPPNDTWNKTNPENEGIFIDYFLGTMKYDEQGIIKAESFAEKICLELFENAIKPLHSVVHAGWVNTGKYSSGTSYYYGDAYCSKNTRCLRDITLEQIQSICVCDKLKHCNVTIIF